MRTTVNLILKKPDTNISKLELVNAMSATMGFAPCTDATSFVAVLDEKIDAQKAELARLAGMRDMVAKLLRDRSRNPWSPGAATVYARILDLLQQHGTLTRPEIANLLAAQAAGAVPLGSISAALSKLAEAGMIVGDKKGWEPKGLDTLTAE